MSLTSLPVTEDTRKLFSSYVESGAKTQVEQEEVLRAFMDRDDLIHFIAPALLPGLGDAFEAVEFTHYPPNTPANDTFYLRIVAWGTLPWVMLSVPLQDEALVEPHLAAVGLHATRNQKKLQLMVGDSFTQVGPDNINIRVIEPKVAGTRSTGASIVERGARAAALKEHINAIIHEYVNAIDPRNGKRYFTRDEEFRLAHIMGEGLSRLPASEQTAAYHRVATALQKYNNNNSKLDPKDCIEAVGREFGAKAASEFAQITQDTLERRRREGMGTLDDYVAYAQRKSGRGEILRDADTGAPPADDDFYNALGKRMSNEQMRETDVWLHGTVKAASLQRPSGSSWHKLMEAAKTNQLYAFRQDAKDEARMLSTIAGEVKSFLVTHDWAGAFAKATEFEEQEGEEFKLPYDWCCWEFRVSDRRVCVLTCSSHPDQFRLYWQGPGETWLSIGVLDAFKLDQYKLNPNETPNALFMLLQTQVRAVCIALDSEVAVEVVEKAPAKLNAKRAKKGKAPLKDYHIVDLNRRRVRSADTGVRDPSAEPRWRVRMHFRRGHWRHYHEDKVLTCTHKWQELDQESRAYCAHCPAWRTWLKWTLVGDPDLGFINKHYRL